MNVFEFLGLSPTHRKSEKTVQKVKNIEEVPESKIKFPLYGQVKKDGVYCMLVSDGWNTAVFGRTGKQLSNCKHLGQRYDLEEGVFIGELCLPEYSLEVLSGIVNPNRTKDVEDDLLFDWFENGEVHFHDHLTLEEFSDGYSDRPYLDRWAHCVECNLHPLAYTRIDSLAHAESYARYLIEAGEEGAVFKQNVGWEAGHKGWRAMKRVRRVEYDLLCVGVEEGKGKYAGKAANLIFQWHDGQTIKAMLGKSYTHEDAKVMWESREHRYNLLNPIGHIFTVYGLQDSSKGKIRLPKVGELRMDKDEPDV